MFGTAALLLGLQLCALVHGATLVHDVKPAAGAKSHCGPIDISCIITEILDGIRDHPDLNPVRLPGISQNYTYGYSRWYVGVSDAILEGIPDFVVDFLNFNPLSGRFDITLSLPRIAVSSPNYIVRGSIDKVVLMHGEGPLQILFGSVSFVASGTVKTQLLPPAITGVENVNCEIRAAEFSFEMTDILGENSDWFNGLVTDNGLEVLSYFSDQINALLSGTLQTLLNNLITGGGSHDGLVVDAETKKLLAGLTEKLSHLVEKSKQ